MTLKYFYFMIVWLFFSTNVIGQNWSIRNFSVEDGLPHPRVVVLHEDHRGYVWVGTYGGGVARFDGTNFESFDESNGLLSGVTMGIQVDSKDNVWVCTPLGISKISEDSVMNFKGKFERGFFGIDIYEHRDSIFTLLNAGNDWRFGIIYNDSIVGTNFTFGLNQKITNAFAPDNNRLLLALETGEILLKQDSFKTIAQGTNVIRFFSSKSGIHALTKEGVFDIHDNGLTLRWTIPDLDWLEVNADFNMGWAWSNGKFMKINFTSTAYSSEPSSLPFDPAFVMFDSEDNCWFGTIGNGVYVLSESNFIKVGESDAAAFAFVHDDDQNLWAGFREGIQIISPDNKLLRQIKFTDAGKSRITSITKDDKGNIIVGTLNGLAIISPNNYKIKWLSSADGLRHHAIRAIEIDHLGRLWIGYMGDHGIDRIENGKIVQISAEQGLISPSIWDLKFSRHDSVLYVCTNLGIQKFSDEKFTEIEIPEFKDKILISLGLYGTDHLIVGSGGKGLALVNLKTNERHFFTKQHGLSSNFIYLADADEQNTVWVGTATGIDQVVLNENKNFKSIIHHDRSSGLNSNGVNTNAIYINGEKKYFGTTQGAFQFQPKRKSQRVNFPLHFVRMEVNNKPIQNGQDSIFEDHENFFMFTFNKVDKSGLTTRYQYQLIPWDNEWINTARDNRAIYSNLDPGSYTMKVRASNPDGNWLDPLTYSFVIKPPFYKRTDVRIITIIALVAIAATVFYLQFQSRVNRIMLAEQERNAEGIRLRKEIGRDFHDEVGNQLARIINYIGLLKLNKSNRIELLDKTEETTKYLLTGTKDFLWSIDPINDNVDSLQIHIRDFAEQVLTEKGIEFRMFSNLHQVVKLPFGFTRQINLIFKEAITNVFKHSNARTAELNVEYINNMVSIGLTDDGCGFEVSNVNSIGQGIDNMRERAHRIGANLEFIRMYPSGTQVKLIFYIT